MSINPWLEEKLKKTHSPQQIEIIVECERPYMESVARDLETIPNVIVHRETASWNRYLPVSAPKETVPKITEIPNVTEVHYNMPKSIRSFRIFDPLIGEIRLSEVEIPGTPLDIVAALPLIPLAQLLNFSLPGYEFIPTSKVREIIKVPEENTVNIKVAILDSGSILPLHPLASRNITSETVITEPEPPYDGLGHGVFNLTSAFMGKASTRFGRVESMADAVNCLSVKCLNNFGFGSSDGILRAMETAYRWGAKVVCMALGGLLQGSAVNDDLECKVINETKDEVIWVCAAGNQGVYWNVNSPGAAPEALTVGSYSPKYGSVSDFSSRGPSGEFYRSHPEIWEKDLEVYGNDLIKPDVLAPGGGPCGGKTPVDLIFSGGQGWTDGQYDLNPDGFSAMRGSSMATAITAGLIALIVESFPNVKARDIKLAMQSSWTGEKDPSSGYGLITYTKIVDFLRGT